MTDDNKSEKRRFALIYKLIKETVDLPYNPRQFMEFAKLFSISIFNRLLFALSFIKLGTTIIIFILSKKSLFSMTLFSELIMALLCLIILRIKWFSKKIILFRLGDEYFTIRVLRVIFVLLFIIDENKIIYKLDSLKFHINPGFIFCVYVSLLYFESNNFSAALLYLYLLNLIIFIYYASWQNFFNCYMPINLVIAMFILIHVVAHNIGRKFSINNLFFEFYEKILEIIAKEFRVKILYEGQVIFPYERKSVSSNNSNNITNGSVSATTKTDSATETQSEMSYDTDLEGVNDKDLTIIPIKGFEGFELAYSNCISFAASRRESIMK